MFLDSGGILQQLHLSATSLGMEFRAIGGFDDKLVEKLFELSSKDLVTSLAVCGR